MMKMIQALGIATALTLPIQTLALLLAMVAGCANNPLLRYGDVGASRDPYETGNTERAASWFELHRYEPLSLRIFLQRMPKGGDIHSHLGGAVYAESYLAWAAEEKPDRLIEYSTLTGSSMIALGSFAGALFTPSDDLASALLASAEEAGERLWRMPMWPEYVRQIKGNHADLKNTGGRDAGAITAAYFISEFAGDVPWVHLDIAGTARVGKDSGYKVTGSTGVGVRTLVKLVEELAENPE